MGSDVRVSREQPWPGLLPFDETATEFFHGRGAESHELVRLIRRETLTVLFGQSGLGKSSLLRAGAFPILRTEEFLPIYLRLDLSAEAATLKTQIFEVLREECRAHSVDAPADAPDNSLWSYFKRPDADFWSSRNRLLTPVLVFDQFEELFTLGRSGGEMRLQCQQFLAELSDLVEHRMPASVAAAIDADPERASNFDPPRTTFRVVFSFREDFLAEFEGLRKFMPSIMRNRLRLTRMDATQALAAILASGSHLVREDVAHRIIRFVSASRSRSADLASDMHVEVEPALLSVVCRELNRRRLDLGREQIDETLLEGSAQQAIVQGFYDDAFNGLAPALRVFVEDQLLTEGGFRDSYAYDDALRLPDVLAAQIDALIDRRLLRKEERAGVWRLELTHDLLTQVARESRDRRQQLAEAEARQAQELARRKRARRLITLGSLGVAAALALSVTFGLLLQQSNLERERLAHEQSRTLLGRANLLLEQGTVGDAQESLAQALVLNPNNLAAAGRAISYLHQRHFPLQLARVPLPPGAPQSPVDMRWLSAHEVALRADREFTVQVPPAAAASAAATSNPAWAPRLPWRAAADPWHLAQQLSAGPSAVNLVAVGGRRVQVAARAGQAGAPGRTAELELEGATGPVVASPDGRRAMLRAGPHKVVVVSIERDLTLRLVHIIDAEQGSLLTGEHGRRLVALGGATVSVYDLDSGRLHELVHPAAVNDLEVHPRRQLIATASQDQNARVWSLSDGRLLGKELRHEGSVLTVSFSADGQQLVSGSLDATARVWWTATGQAAMQPLLHAAEVALARLAPDGGRVATWAADGVVQFWRTEAQVPHRFDVPLPGLPHMVAHDASAGRYAAAWSGGQLGLWNTAAPGQPPGPAQRAWQLGLGAPISAMGLSADGQQLAIATETQGLHFLDAATGRRLAPLLPHPSAVQSLAYSPDGQWLAAGAADGTLRTYDTRQRRIDGLVMVHAPGDVVTALRFSPDGRYLLSEVRRPNGAAVWLWSMATRRGQQVQQAGRVVLSQFTDASAFLTVADKVVGRYGITAPTAPTSAPAATRQPSDLRLTADPWAAALSTDRRLLAVGGLNGVTQVYELQPGLRRIGEAMKGVGVVESVAFSADGRWLLTRTAGGLAQVWGTQDGVPVADPIVTATGLQQAHFDRSAAAVIALAEGHLLTTLPLGLDLPLPAPAWLPALLRQSADVLAAGADGAPPRASPAPDSGTPTGDSGAWWAQARRMLAPKLHPTSNARERGQAS